MSENQPPDFGAAGRDARSSEGKRRKATRTVVGRFNFQDAKRFGLYALVALGIVGGIKACNDLTPKETAGKSDIPKSFADLLQDPQVQALVNDKNLTALIFADPNSEVVKMARARGKDPVVEARNRILGGINRTQVYLEEGSVNNWQLLIGYLNADQPITDEQVLFVLGQRFALQKVGCLSDGYINEAACNQYPGFKNLDPKTKQEYVKKYNSFIDKAKASYPSFFGGSSQSRNLDRAPGREQQARAFDAAKVKRASKEQRSTRRLRG